MVSSSSSFAPVRGSDDHAEVSEGVIELSNHHLATTENDGNASVLVVTTPEVSHHADDDLTMLQAAALLTADCLGTGLLALPQDILVLGKALGFGFLIFNLPVNWYVGALLSRAASHVEDTLEEETQQSRTGVPASAAAAEEEQGQDGRDGLLRARKRTTKNSTYSSVQQQIAEDGICSDADSTTRSSQHALDDSSPDDDSTNNGDSNGVATTMTTTAQDSAAAAAAIADDEDDDSHNHHKARHHHPHEHADDDTTHDYIGLTKLVFPHPHATQYQPRVTHLVITVFYTNIFLVLGDYILVMSHAVAAMIGEGSICLPTAGIVASTLMFGFSQLRTMANLGRSVTVLSLSSLAIVVIQCLVAGERQQASSSYVPPYSSESDDTSTIRKLSALASIGFATGPNKLLLNIRNEMKNRDESPSSLGVSMTTFGSVYVAICLLAGPSKLCSIEHRNWYHGVVPAHRLLSRLLHVATDSQIHHRFYLMPFLPAPVVE